jgi:hypothetical protein
MSEVIVPLPPEGTPAEFGALCGVDGSVPVDGGWAARVALRTSPTDRTVATGTITIAAEPADRVVGIPSVAVVDIDPGLSSPSLGAVSAPDGGYTFEVVWPALPFANPYRLPPRIVIETRFAIDCGDGQTREVHALTGLYLCADEYAGVSDWASSGDTCINCATICEMAPAPSLVPESNGTAALSSAVTLRVRPIGQVHGALVLLAEHNGGAGRFSYQWQASGGRLLWVDRDVALWMPPTRAVSPELVQVAAQSADAAAVASLRWGVPA